jgi:hypothetical protein
MTDSSRSGELTQILQGLTTLPGGKHVSIKAKHFPRLGPAGDNSGYQEQVWHFSTADGPAAMDIPTSADEIIVTLRGDMARPKGEVLSSVSAVVERVSEEWDYRVLTHLTGGGSEYEVQVFSRTPGW